MLSLKLQAAIAAGLVAAGLAGSTASYLKGRTDGRTIERAAAAAAASEAERRGALARDSVDACYDAGGRWLQREGRCQLPRVPGAEPGRDRR